MADKRQILGRGLYSPAEAARLLHTPSRRVRRWLFGVQDSSHGTHRDLASIIKAGIQIDSNYYVTFEGFIELLAINAFRRAGVSMHMVRAAHDKARMRFLVDYPFSTRPFFTDGTHIFSELQDDDPSNTALDDIDKQEELARGQLAFEQLIRPCLKDIDFDHNRPMRYWPQGHDSVVVLDAERNFGKPIIEGVGVPTIALYRSYKAEKRIERIASWYQVTEQAVCDAIAFEKRIERAA